MTTAPDATFNTMVTNISTLATNKYNAGYNDGVQAGKSQLVTDRLNSFSSNSVTGSNYHRYSNSQSYYVGGFSSITWKLTLDCAEDNDEARSGSAWLSVDGNYIVNEIGDGSWHAEDYYETSGTYSVNSDYISFKVEAYSNYNATAKFTITGIK